MSLDVKDAPATLYRRIRGDIERRILSGEWPPGHRVPPEHELMAEYDCSRMTVSKALGELAQADLIERRKRAGTFVKRPQVMSAVLDIADIRAEIGGLGRAYGYELLSRRKRKGSRADCARLGVKAVGDVLALECVHSADGFAFAHESRLIDLTAVPEAEKADFASEPPGTWLLDHVPWSEAEHRISAVPATDDVAARLDVTAGDACLVIERKTWRGGRTLTAVRLTYPGNQHQLVARFGGR